MEQITFQKAKKKLINACLTNIHSTNEIHRTPQILIEKKSWKITERRCWLLFYNVSILSGILQQNLLDSANW